VWGRTPAVWVVARTRPTTVREWFR
jgi:hypothetical protein